MSRNGMVTILGRPNVGKSSLLNALLKKKVSIVSHKPQTTRHRIQGVLHHEGGQIVFVDTPGLHRETKKALNRAMNKAASGAISDVDVILFVVEACRWTDEDAAVLEKLTNVEVPVGLVVNKVDLIPDKEKLLPELEVHLKRRDFAFIVPVSASKKDNLDALKEELLKRMPEAEPMYPPELDVGHSKGFTVAELIREKIIRNLHQELPYATTVTVENYKRDGNLDRIDAVIWVEREGQKKIVIGKGGASLKLIGTSARRELEKMLDRKIMLRLWCKVKENWSDDALSLKRFGLTPD